MSVAQSWSWGSQSANKKKFEQTLYFVSVFLLPFSTSKQLSAVVLALFQGQYPRAITMQLIRQLQWTDTKATSENLTIYFLENNKAQQRLTKKVYSLLIYHFYIPAGIYLLKVNNGNTRTRCEICSKLIIKISEWRHWRLYCYLYC